MRKERGHLPFFGIGPLYVGLVCGLTAAGVWASNSGLLESGIVPGLKVPMRVAGVLMSIGVAMLWYNLWLMLLPFVSWWLMGFMMRHTEEKWLRRLYGAEYDAYCRRVNRTWPWFPKK